MPGNNLVIVESAAKSKTITKYLNSSKELKHLGKFIVAASFGHVRDLKKNCIGIDIDNDFSPMYDVIDDKKRVVNELKKKAKDASIVYIASDPDREGESIASHLKEVLNLKTYKRITFTEITPKALENAIKHPRTIDRQLVDAQEARRTLDRLVGFKLSPLLWKKYTTQNVSTLSAGRVQSAVLHMMIEKENQVISFKTTPYWNVSGNFILRIDKQTDTLKDIKLYKENNVFKIESGLNDVIFLLKALQNKFSIQDVKTRISRQNADQPYITSTLQQDAYNRLGMSLKRSMQVAQELYENGLITYMRTDSFNMSEDFKQAAKTYIDQVYGIDYYEGGRLNRRVVKGAQEAHECIRITSPVLEKLQGSTFSRDHVSLYEMIWKRTIAYLMKACIYDELEIKIKDKSFVKDMYFIATYKKIKFNGYQVVYGTKIDIYNFEDYVTSLNRGLYSIDCNSVTCKNVWTSPPQRYNESTIVKALETEGLGRPSTYSTIMSKLFERRYIIKTDVSGEEKNATHLHFVPEQKDIKKEEVVVKVGAEKTKLVPTEIGKEIDNYLSDHFAYIVDKKFTAYMESDLDQIACGDKKRLDVLKTFWKQFNKDLVKQDNIPYEKKTKLQTQHNDIMVDGKSYVVRIAKYGPVVQYDVNKYINLKPYLLLVRKQYTEINEDDLRFLTSMPKDLLKVDGYMASLSYGPYGLYLKYNGSNVGITKRFAMTVIQNEHFDENIIRNMIEYKKNKDTIKTSQESNMVSSKTSQTKVKSKKNYS